MAWIETHQTLPRHPKTFRAATLLGVSRPCVVGHLQCLWLWALDYAPDGDLSRYEREMIADAAMWDGDASELISALSNCGAPGQAGFLERTEDGRLLIHDWDEYAGRLIKARQDDAARAAARRNFWPTIMARDGHRCCFCGAERDLTLDHIVPLSRGGSNEYDNLQILCRPCNSRKGAR